MYVGQFVAFKWARRGSSSQPRDWGERPKFYTPLFDAINRRNDQPTTVTIIFRSLQSIPVIKR